MSSASRDLLAGKPAHIASWFIFAAGSIAATAIRLLLVPLESADFLAFRDWYAFIADGGFRNIVDRGDYNVPYYYLQGAVAAALPWLDPSVAVKGIHIAFDYALAFAVYKCVGRKSASCVVPLLAALVTLLAPTVLTNSSMYGQCDAIFTTFLVACLYFLLAGRQAWAFVAFGLALSFKPQAVLLAPLFLWLLAGRACDWRWFLLVPAVFLAGLIPAWLLGIPLSDLLAIYWHLAAQQTLTLSAGLPNFYVWLPDGLYRFWPLGVFFATGVVLAVAVAVRRASVKMTDELIVLLATYSLLVMPYILPKMHQRYFFAAEVVAIVLAFHLPRYWFVPVIVGLASFSAYLKELLFFDFVDIKWWALVVLGVVAILTGQVLAMLSSSRVLSRRQLLVSSMAWLLAIGAVWLAHRVIDSEPGEPSDDSSLNAPAETARPLGQRLSRYRDYATATIQTALPRTLTLEGTLRANPRFWAAYERVMAGEAGEPWAGAWAGIPSSKCEQCGPFDVYRDGNTLIYVKQPCSQKDFNAVTFVQATSVDGGARGFRFRMRQRGIREGDLCVAMASLPYYEVWHVRTGQQRYSEHRQSNVLLWAVEGMMSIWERPPTFEANPRYRAAYEQAIADEFGAPLGRSRFDVYRDGRTLIYIKQPCRADDIRAPFFLQVSNPPNVSAGWSFLFLHRGVMGPFMGQEACIATARLPNYAIDNMRTGQHRDDGTEPWAMWTVEAPMRPVMP